MAFQKSVCIEPMYGELPFLERFQAAKEDGFDFVEFWSWTDKDLDAVKAAAESAGGGISGFNGDADLSLIDPEQKEAYLAFLRRSVEAAKKVGARSVTIHSNGLGDGGVVINHYDGLSDTVKLCAMFDTLRECFGKSVAPVVVPIWDENKKVTGVVDVIHKRAFEPAGNKRKEVPIPADKQGVVDELYDQLMESVAETSEELMEKFFSGESFTYAEIMQGLRSGVRDCSLVPVVCGSSYTGLGTLMLLDFIVDLLPNPLEGVPASASNKDGEHEDFIVSQAPSPPPSCSRPWPTSTASSPLSRSSPAASPPT